ncbi:MAG: ABC transporter substrate-binding protein [Treponema sp.]|jgi:multiple sugar transport system substrate-binding protein|nr:ABC transporter substrate-binding protein [Treponema sp.]
MKRVLAAVGALLVLGALFSCKKKTEGGGTEKVVFWTSHGPPDNGILESIADAYNATGPEVEVQFVQVPGSETDVTSLMTAVRGGTGPDVYMLDRFTVAQRASDGLLEDLTDDLAELDPNLKDKYLAFAWDEDQYRGRTYGLPFDTDTRGLFYNKQMLRDAGVDPEELDRKNGPITLARLQEIARKIDTKDAQGNYTKAGFIPQVEQGWHYTWGFLFGGEFADIPGGKVTPTHPGVVAGFQYLYDYNREMGVQQVQTFISSYIPPNNPPQQHPFITGRLAMMITGDWFLNTMRTYAPDVEYDITYIPTVNKGDPPTTWAGGWTFVVPAGSKRKEAAVRFIHWACGAGGQRIYTKDSGHCPTLLSISSDESIFTEKQSYFREALFFTKSRPPLPVGALYWDALSTAQDMVVQNVKTPLEALQQAEQQTQSQLNKFLPL